MSPVARWRFKQFATWSLVIPLDLTEKYPCRTVGLPLFRALHGVRSSPRRGQTVRSGCRCAFPVSMPANGLRRDVRDTNQVPEHQALDVLVQIASPTRCNEAEHPRQ